MICHSILLGAVGGFVAAKLVGRRHCGHAVWHHHGPRHGWHRRGPGRLFGILRELDLDRDQRRQAWEATGGVRRAVAELRGERFEVLDGLADAVGAETFDRAAAERAVGHGGAALDRVREEVLRAVERLHSILTPEQRARLRQLLDRSGPGGPDGGPYRASL